MQLLIIDTLIVIISEYLGKKCSIFWSTSQPQTCMFEIITFL